MKTIVATVVTAATKQKTRTKTTITKPSEKTMATAYVRKASKRNAVGAGTLPKRVKAISLVTAKPKSLQEYLKAAAGNLRAHLGWMFGAVKMDGDDLVVMLDTRDSAKANECFRRIKPALDPLGIKDFQVKLIKIKSDDDDGDFFDCRVEFQNPLKKAFASTAETARPVNVLYCVVLEDTSGDELLLGSGCVKLTKVFAKYGVSAHVLPGQESINGNPLFILVGTSPSQMANAIQYGYGGDPETYNIVKIPV
jgi:hypothetical protein